MIKKGGIIRNKIKSLRDIKEEKERKRHRFQQVCFKDEQSLTPNDAPDKNLLQTSGTLHALNSTASSNGSLEEKESNEYHEAKVILKAISQIQKKLKGLVASRFTSFKQSEVKSIETKIDGLSNEAMQKISQADRILQKLRNTHSQNANQQQIMRNLQRSLAAQIRESTKSLRQQERDYYQRLKSYEKHSTNLMIQLPQKTPDISDNNQLEQEQLDSQRDTHKNQQIQRLYQSITKLSTIYKQMNQLVIDQGSLVDRIDYNIDVTLKHTTQAVVHLKGAEQAASSPFAERIIRGLLVTIVLLAVVMGYKFSK